MTLEDRLTELENLEYLRKAEAESQSAFWRGFEEGLKTHWRWRLWFWLRDALSATETRFDDC